MTERTAHELMMLDMLGDELRDAVIDARDRLVDETIMARIGESTFEPKVSGLVAIERGAPAVILEQDLSTEAAIAYLGELE